MEKLPQQLDEENVPQEEQLKPDENLEKALVKIRERKEIVPGVFRVDEKTGKKVPFEREVPGEPKKEITNPITEAIKEKESYLANLRLIAQSPIQEVAFENKESLDLLSKIIKEKPIISSYADIIAGKTKNSLPSSPTSLSEKTKEERPTYHQILFGKDYTEENMIIPSPQPLEKTKTNKENSPETSQKKKGVMTKQEISSAVDAALENIEDKKNEEIEKAWEIIKEKENTLNTKRKEFVEVQTSKTPEEINQAEDYYKKALLDYQTGLLIKADREELPEKDRDKRLGEILAQTTIEEGRALYEEKTAQKFAEAEKNKDRKLKSSYFFRIFSFLFRENNKKEQRRTDISSPKDEDKDYFEQQVKSATGNQINNTAEKKDNINKKTIFEEVLSSYENWLDAQANLKSLEGSFKSSLNDNNVVKKIEETKKEINEKLEKYENKVKLYGEFSPKESQQITALHDLFKAKEEEKSTK